MTTWLRQKVFFSDVSPLVEKGLTKNIESGDIFALPAHLSPETKAVDEDKVNWSTWKTLLLTLFWQARPYWAQALLFVVLCASLNALSPILVHEFVKYLELGAKPLWLTILYGVGIGVAGLGSGLALQHFFYRVIGLYQILTNTINRKLYRHSLQLHKAERDQMPVGDIVNHMSSDSDSVANLGAVAGDIIYSAISIIGFVVLLFYYLGHTAWVGLIALLALIPLTHKSGKNFSRLDDQLMKKRDERVTLMSQILSAIRVVKYFVWERSVIREVQKVRHEELRIRGQLALADMTTTLIFVGLGTIILFLVLAVHVARGNPMDAALVFTLVSLFRIVEEPFAMISRHVSHCANARVSAKRIASFLGKLETNDQAIEKLSSLSPSVIEVQNLTVEYGEVKALDNVSFTVSRGENFAIVGAVGAGKTTLLNVILGEIEFQGRVARCSQKWAFVPQEAYIINSSVKENLSFGDPNLSDEDWQQAIYAACLEEDLRGLPAGLETEIGERGLNLSGGQKQRFSLARSILQKPDLVLLDDPLSAVDPKVEDQLMERLIHSVWGDITRVTVTHRIQHLREFDRILFLEAGRVGAVGTFDELEASCVGFQEFLRENQSSQGDPLPAHETPTVAKEVAKEKTSGRVTEDEDREVGAVKKSVYWDYVKSLGGKNAKLRPLILFTLFAAAIVATSLPLVQKTWLAWVTNAQKTGAVPWEMDFLKGILTSPAASIAIYGLLGVLTLAGVLASDLYWLRRGLRAGRDLHNSMLVSILRGQIRFFDSTPVGRILQRFSRDMEQVDIELQWSFEKTVQHLFQVLANLFLIVAVLPAVVVFIVPIFWVYYQVQKKYRITAREVKRLDSVSRSPRYAHFKETLQGLVVLRSLGQQNWFYHEFIKRLAYNQHMFYGHYMVNRWFSSRIPMIGALVAISTTVVITVLVTQGSLSAGVAGLVTVSSLGFWGVLNWGIRIFAEVEARMTSVERIKFFIGTPQEPKQPFSSELLKRTDWPEKGEVEFVDVHARYAPHLPPVLKGLSFKIEAGTRIGIIGRTGSGKSTIFQTLYRFLELDSGCILIDGFDISKIPLQRLRSSIAIIPQDPTLFLGTLKTNLDRFNERTEAEIWAVLEKVHLADFVRSLPNGLDSEVVENGANLSQGQRQLMCLARALLVQAKIIILDEATASVDVKTDAVVQKVIRQTCAGMTMLIIAHRLGTVRDCDQILELQDGRLRRRLTPNAKSETAPVQIVTETPPAPVCEPKQLDFFSSP